MKTFILISGLLFMLIAYDHTNAAGNNTFTNNCRFISLPHDSINLQLADFLGVYKKNSVILNWTTTSQEDGDRFEIERSTDGFKFAKTGNIAGTGASDINTLYAFTDNAKAISASKNDLFYRIKKIDKNGIATYSKALTVHITGARS